MLSRKVASRCCRLALAVAVVAAMGLQPVAAEAQGTAWVGTWATAPVALPPADGTPPARPGPAQMEIDGQTLRQIVRTSIGGAEVRVVITNVFGSQPLEIGAAQVALRADGAALVSGTSRTLQFGGQPTTAVPPGDVAISDPVELDVPALGDLAVDLYLPGIPTSDPSGATVHGTGLTTNYLSKAGNHAGASTLPVDRTFQNWFYLSRVEVEAAAGTPVIVALGDSITDGTASTPDTNSRWPDFLARRLIARPGNTPPAVLNLGIAGNRVLSDNAGLAQLLGNANAPLANPNAQFGPAALKRFDRDVLSQPGVTHVIVLESTNDIGMAFESETPTVEEIVAGHTELVERAHARGLKIYGGTLAPFEGAFYFRPIGEKKRQAFNEWMRTSGVYDGVIDFDAAVRDAAAPSKMVESYQSGDWLHPSDEGYRVMAQAVDLALFED
jgi:lysophospholipase L1-like esterase